MRREKPVLGYIQVRKRSISGMSSLRFEVFRFNLLSGRNMQTQAQTAQMRSPCPSMHISEMF